MSRYFLRFYRTNGREFPWRTDGIPSLGVLLAEMLLRQTRAEQVSVIWPMLVDNYPDATLLAAADPDQLFELLKPLGLGRQRVVAIQSMASALIRDHNGEVPRDIGQITKLPHVGVYAAHAVACFAFRKRVPIVDTNVIRVFSRLTGRDFGRDNRRSEDVWKLAKLALPLRASVQQYNYGLLDFAATICKPRVPLCQECGLRRHCNWASQMSLETGSVGKGN